MTSINTVILNEVKNPENFFNHYSLDSSLRFRMTDKRKDVIGNPTIKQMLHLNGNDINLHSYSERSEESRKFF